MDVAPQQPDIFSVWVTFALVIEWGGIAKRGWFFAKML